MSADLTPAAWLVEPVDGHSMTAASGDSVDYLIFGDEEDARDHADRGDEGEYVLVPLVRADAAIAERDAARQERDDLAGTVEQWKATHTATMLVAEAASAEVARLTAERDKAVADVLKMAAANIGAQSEREAMHRRAQQAEGEVARLTAELLPLRIYHSTGPGLVKRVDELVAENERLQDWVKPKSAPARCPGCDWCNTNAMNYSTVPNGPPMWLCHGCAARRIEDFIAENEALKAENERLRVELALAQRKEGL